MARTIDASARAVRRDAFVDVGQRLIQSRGYDAMSVQDVLDELAASRGAFYHYFESKEDLLEAVVARMGDAAKVDLDRLVDDPALAAPAKLEAVFASLARFKADRRELVLALVEAWLSDRNAIVREKLRRRMSDLLSPLLARIVRQGQAEGTFTASSADGAARVLVALLQGANEEALGLLLARHADAVPLEVVERAFAAYQEAFERVLGARPGSISLIDQPNLELWFGGGKERA